MAVAGKDLDCITAFKVNMSDQFETTDLGEIHYMLGLQISHDRDNHTIQLDQSAYIDSILNCFGMTTCHEMAMPLATNHNLSSLQSSKTAEEGDLYIKYANSINYLSMVSLLLYTTQTRPDIQFAISLVAQFANNLGIPHLTTCKQILWYLKSIKYYGLVLGGFSNDKINLVGWSNAN